MKKFLILFLLCSVSLLFSLDFYQARSDHFQVSSTLSSEDAAEQAYRMEQLFGYIHHHLNLQDPGGSFKVYRFQDKGEYLKWQKEQFGTENPGFQLYSKYSFTPLNLAVYGDLTTPEAFSQLSHLFVHQLLLRVNSDTPAWLRWGLAVYYEKLRINTEGQLREEETVYLDWVKKNRTDATWLTPSSLINLTEEELRNDPELKGELWLFTSFLMEKAQSDQSRILWESVSLINQGPQESWPGQNLITQSLNKAYSEFRKELSLDPLKELRLLYEREKYTEALEWIDLQEKDYDGSLSYFRGLIEYHLGEWEKATEDFTLALERGAPEMETRLSLALCYWQMDKSEALKEELQIIRAEREDLIPEELRHLVY